LEALNFQPTHEVSEFQLTGRCEQTLDQSVWQFKFGGEVEKDEDSPEEASFSSRCKPTANKRMRRKAVADEGR
jgi:hypothetical protein